MAFSAPTETLEKQRPPEGEALSLFAGSDLTAGQVVKLDANGDAVPSDTNGEVVIGVAMQTVSSGEQVHVNGSGARVLLTAAESINEGEKLTSGTGTNNGEVQTANTTGDFILGYALTAAGSQGDTFTAVIDRGGEVN